MSKKTKIKTTLDKRHKDTISVFENRDNSVKEIQNYIDANNIMLEEFESIPYINCPSK